MAAFDDIGAEYWGQGGYVKTRLASFDPLQLAGPGVILKSNFQTPTNTNTNTHNHFINVDNASMYCGNIQFNVLHLLWQTKK